MNFIKNRYENILKEIFDESRRELIKKNAMTLSERINKNFQIEPAVKELILQQLLNFKKISVIYWMRNLSCSEEAAKHYIIASTNHSCTHCNGMSINYFNKEFSSCKCFKK